MEDIEMGKYAESVGIWEHKLEGITHRIKPEEQDNLEFVRVKKEAEKASDEGILLKGVSELYIGMVLRSDKTLTEIDKQELRIWVSLNINQITEDLMVAYKWTTPEQLQAIKKRMLEGSQKKKTEE